MCVRVLFVNNVIVMFKLLRPRAKSLSAKGAGGGGGSSVEKLVLCKPPRSSAGSPRQKQGKHKRNFFWCGVLAKLEIFK